MHPIPPEILQKFASYWSSVSEKGKQITRKLFNPLEMTRQTAFRYGHWWMSASRPNVQQFFEKPAGAGVRQLRSFG